MNTLAKQLKVISALLATLLLFYLAFLNYLEPTQTGLARNAITGKMWLQDRAGWHLTAVWVRVARIDTRPLRVSVDSAGRAYSAKLVQFEPKAWREFAALEGFRYYWWDNRLSFNFGYKEEHRGLKDILRGYAYSPKKYPFISTLKEFEVR